MRKLKTAEWMGAAFIAGLAIAGAAHAVAVPSRWLGMALRGTARWSFLWFCLATYGGPLAALAGSSFQALARHGRDFGLAFASANSVHVALVVWLLYVSPDPFPRLQLVIFSIGVLVMYVLAVFSLSSTLSAWLGPRPWKYVRTLGVEYLAFTYAFEFGARILAGNRANALHYFPLFAAALGGPLLRIGASIKRRSNVDHTAGLLRS
jgi:hypothetical protein